MECKNCCYYGFSEGVEYEHCLFREIHSDEDIAPCDDPSYDPLYEEVNLGYEEY